MVGHLHDWSSERALDVKVEQKDLLPVSGWIVHSTARTHCGIYCGQLLTPERLGTPHCYMLKKGRLGRWEIYYRPDRFSFLQPLPEPVHLTSGQLLNPYTKS
jgi:hypothetical protein